MSLSRSQLIVLIIQRQEKSSIYRRTTMKRQGGAATGQSGAGYTARNYITKQTGHTQDYS